MSDRASHRRSVCHDDAVNDVDTGATAAPNDLHSRLVASRFGRMLTAGIIGIMTLSIVAPNMPASALKDQIEEWWSPVTSIGLQQDWGVFSPNPRDQSLDVRARIEYADGTVEFWDLPELDPIVGAYRQYRWQKWQERVREDGSHQLWEPTVRWIVDNHTSDGRVPERVVLIRRWIDHLPPTAEGKIVDGGWNQFEFYTWEAPT